MTSSRTKLRKKLLEYNWTSDKDFQIAVIAFDSFIQDLKDSLDSLQTYKLSERSTDKLVMLDDVKKLLDSYGKEVK